MRLKSLDDLQVLENAEPIRRFFEDWSEEQLRRGVRDAKKIFEDMKAVSAIAALKDQRKKPQGILQGNVPVFLAIEIARRTGKGPLLVAEISREMVDLGYSAPSNSREFQEDPRGYFRGYVTSAYGRRAVIDA